MSEWSIQTEGLEKTYGNKNKTYALRGVDIKIPKGSFSCIVGPSGHGKSTLLQLIGGLDTPTKGCVSIDGTDISNLSDSKLSEVRAEKIGFVFQFFNLLESLTAIENIETAMIFTKANRKSSRKRAIELIKLVGLSDKLNSKPSELSGGQLQRIAIARALANDPEILLMDEPTGNLDSETEQEVMKCISDIHKMGKTIVIVTHSSDIASQAEVVFEVYDGLLV
ncbi:MAG: ABC transporter ATP-binding protein [Oscillospiraceae bacterium]|nr:ABC transporter ATP-binding protein [Oscillospiraceae bacterium]